MPTANGTWSFFMPNGDFDVMEEEVQRGDASTYLFRSMHLF